MKLPTPWYCAVFLLLVSHSAHSQYNPLWIPDTLSGTTFNLTVQDTFKQFLPGQQTITAGVNGNWWGPTLFFNKGDTVHLHVNNNLMDSTTMHWHGVHLPAAMDGGPLQPISPMTTWSPYFKVRNNAATYWYHPHLHMMTEEQINMGIGGLIIVRDSIESALTLPRSYGIDDIPLVLTDRRFDTTGTNQLLQSHYGDTMVVNGTLNPEYNVPAQIVRLRILNAAPERSYRLGFSNNQAFRIIATDGGLLNAPVSQTRFTIAPGERVEILASFIGLQGQSLDLVAYNNTLPGDIGGATPGSGVFANALGGRQFNILHLNVVAQTANPVTTFPTTLTSNSFWPEASATITRHITMYDAGNACPPGLNGCGWLDSVFFDINVINHITYLNTTEIWEVENQATFAHPFHIHGLQFYILDKNGSLPPTYERGWKDIIQVRPNTTVRLITKFENYTDSNLTYMYHCHIAFHEDAGMMGQFLVIDTTTPPVAVIQVNDTVICEAECVNFSAMNTTGADSLRWNFPGGNLSTDTAQQATVCYLQDGMYAASLIAYNEKGSDTAFVTITINANPVVNYFIPDSVCQDEGTVTLNATPAGGTFAGNGVAGFSFDPLLTSAGVTYISYIYADSNGCVYNDSVTIFVKDTPVVALYVPDSVCINAGNVLLAGSPAGGIYSGTAVTDSTFSPLIAGTGIHTLYYDYTNEKGCSGDATGLIVVNDFPLVTLTTADSVCINNGIVALNGNPSGGIYSGNGVTDSVFNPLVALAGTHAINYVYTDSNGCSNTVSATITVNDIPVITFTQQDSVCIDAVTVLLSANPLGGIYSGTGVADSLFDPQVAGVGMQTVYYNYTDEMGCSNTDSAFIIVNDLPVVALTALDSVCVNAGTVSLIANPTGGIYSGMGVTDSLFDPKVAGVGIQTVYYNYTDPNGCSNADSAFIIVNDVPTVLLMAPDTICIWDGTVTLYAIPPGGIYSGTAVTDSIFDPIVAGTGDHSVYYEYMDSLGCVNTDSSVITVVNCGAINEQLIQNEKLSIFPNPANAVLHILYKGKTPAELFVMDPKGSVVISKQLQSNYYELDLSRINTGLYFIKVISQEAIYITKMQKQ